MLEEQEVDCPYCGEYFTALINIEDVDNPYIEDCFVCCRPITFIVQENEQQQLIVKTKSENE